jgi:LysR family nitrogen assimilation transcriptional regulator
VNLKQLTYFVQVAELGSFSRAAKQLEIAQPALSRQVRQLEIELRQSLLYRNGRGVRATEAGKRLVNHARGILHQVARAEEDLRDARGALAGRVAVGLPPSVAKTITVPLTKEFRRRLPEATLSIIEGMSVTMQEWLALGRLDIALLHDPVPAPGIDTVPLLEEDLFLVCPRSAKGGAKPIGLADLSGVPLIIPNRPHAIRTLVESRLAALGRKLQIAFEIDGVSSILELVAEGLGCAILPRTAMLTSAKPGVFVARPIVRPRLKSRLAIAVSSQRPVTPTQQAVLDLIRDLGRAMLAGG